MEVRCIREFQKFSRVVSVLIRGLLEFLMGGTVLLLACDVGPVVMVHVEVEAPGIRINVYKFDVNLFK